MLHDLLECLGGVGDPREAAKVEHRLIDVLAITVCAVLAHAESFEDIALYGRSKRAWLSRFLELPGGIPSHDTFRRVLMLIDPEEFEQGFLAWTRRAFVRGREDDGAPPQIAVDGKTLRRSFDRRRGATPLHLVSAFATASGLVLAQRRVAEKGGELAALPDLLAGLDVRGALISLDAVACQPGVAATITGRGGDYLIALKGNGRALHAAAKAWFAERAFAPNGGAAPLRGQHGWASRPARAPVRVRGRRHRAAGGDGTRRRLARPAPRHRRGDQAPRGEPRARRAAGREPRGALLPDQLGGGRDPHVRRHGKLVRRRHEELAPSIA